MTARVNRETADDYIFCEGHVRGSEQNSDHKGGQKPPFQPVEKVTIYGGFFALDVV